MHPVARLLAVAYVALGVVGAILYAQTTVNYANVTQVSLNIEDNVRVARVDIRWSGDPSETPIVKVWINVTNPGAVRIEVFDVSFQLHMDDPSDLRHPFDGESLANSLVRPGGNTTSRGRGLVIPPGQTRSIESVITVETPTQFARFDRPDVNGRYHPVVWQPQLSYAFVDFDIASLVFLPPYYDALGVVPHA